MAVVESLLKLSRHLQLLQTLSHQVSSSLHQTRYLLREIQLLNLIHSFLQRVVKVKEAQDLIATNLSLIQKLTLTMLLITQTLVLLASVENRSHSV